MQKILPIILLLVASASGAGAIDATGAAETNVERARNAMNACTDRPTKIEWETCYTEVARRIAIKTKRAIEDIGDTKDARMQTALKKSQTLWGALLANECDQIAALQFEGGSGQGLNIRRCEIMALAARLDVMGIAP